MDFPAGNRKAAFDITERPVKSDEKTFSHSAPWYPIQQQNLKWFCFVTAAKKQNACNIADCGWYERKRACYKHFTFTSHRSFPNSQQFFNHRTYFLACLVYRGFDLSHLSNVNQLWLTLPPHGRAWQPNSTLTVISMETALYYSLHYCPHFPYYKSQAQRNTITTAQKYGRLWLCHVSWKAYFFLTVLPFFNWHNTLSIHYRLLWVRPDQGTLLGSGLACPWHPIPGDHLSDDIFSFWKGKLGFFPQQEGHW